MRPHRTAVFLIAALVLATCASAQRPPDIALTPQINREVVANTIKAISKYYLSIDIARNLESDLQRRLDAGEYDAIASAFDLVDVLDMHMQAVSGDRHLALAYSHRAAPPVKDVGENIRPETPDERAESLAEAERRNFGFEKASRLPGNVGLLELNSFVRPEFGGEMAGRAFAFLASTDALIIDLRSSQGGAADMVPFLASYFFPGDETHHLGDWHTRVEAVEGTGGGVQNVWTYPYLPGERYLNKPVFILTAARTFSAPEGLAALLQHHRKAKVVGEATAGGTHPGVMVRVHPHFAVFTPVSFFAYPAGEPASPLNRAIFPERKLDATGAGVKPDIAVPAAEAMKAAHIAALQAILESHADRKDDLQPLIDRLRGE